MPKKSPPGLEKRHIHCSICALLGDREYATQTYGWEDEATFLPPVSNNLELVYDLAPGSSRASQLRKCPECNTFYLYTSDYEYLVNGTEDEETLARLTDDEAAEYMERDNGLGHT